MDTITLPSGATLKPGSAWYASNTPTQNSQSRERRDFDFFEKDNLTFKVPTTDKNIKEVTVSAQKSIITNIDNALEKFYNLVPAENIGIKTWCWYSKAEGTIRYSDTVLSEAIREKYGLETLQRYRLARAKIDGDFFSLKYDGSGKFTIYINAAFKKLVASLLPVSEHITKSICSYEEFALIIDKVTSAINKLFVNEGLEASAQNRSNLISLVYTMSASIKKTKKVKALLGVASEDYDVKSKQLIHAAANGYNSNFVKLFYIQNCFPKDSEDFKVLTALPYDMLIGILGGK
jgi:hypothetical protein